MASEAFKERVLNDLLPAFCNDPARNYDIAGFKSNFGDVHYADAEAFLRAFDARLVQLDGNMYRAPRSSAREQLFWEGTKKKIPRSIKIWAEPIITIGTLARLHFDFGWPKELLGTQSKDYAFDLVAYLPSDLANEYIACEVKKSARELSSLIERMNTFGASPARLPANDKEKNAHQKVVGLRSRKAPLFWAVGPGHSGSTFRVSYKDDGEVILDEVSMTALHYPG